MGKIFREWVPASYPLKTPGNDGLPTGTRSLALVIVNNITVRSGIVPDVISLFLEERVGVGAEDGS